MSSDRNAEGTQIGEETAEGGVRAGRFCDGSLKNERRVRLEEIVTTVRDRFVYEYDFGDCWQHDVLVEAVLLPEPGRAIPSA